MFEIRQGKAEQEMTWQGVDGIDCIITSPPYNIGVQYDGVTDTRTKEDYSWLVIITFKLLADRANPGCSLWVNLSPKDPLKAFGLIANIQSGGWDFQQDYAWVFSYTDHDEGNLGRFSPSNHNAPHRGYESLFLFRRKADPPIKLDRLALGVPYSDKTNLKRFNSDGDGGDKADLRCRGNVWHIPYPNKTGNQCKHPCPFPPTLPAWCIATTPPPDGGLVVDPFSGSGSVGIAALYNDLQFIGVDLSEKYCKESRERLAEFKLAVDRGDDLERYF